MKKRIFSLMRWLFFVSFHCAFASFSLHSFVDTHGTKALLKASYLFATFQAHLPEITEMHELFYRLLAPKSFVERTFGVVPEDLAPQEDAQCREVFKNMQLPHANKVMLKKVHLGSELCALAVNDHYLLLDVYDIHRLGLSNKAFDFLIGHESAHLLNKDLQKLAFLYVFHVLATQASTYFLFRVSDSIVESVLKKKHPFIWEVAKPFLAFYMVKIMAAFFKKHLKKCAWKCEYRADAVAGKAIGMQGAREFFAKALKRFGDDEDSWHPRLSKRFKRLEIACKKRSFLSDRIFG